MRDEREKNDIEIRAKEKEIDDYRQISENQRAFEKEKSGLENRITQLIDEVSEEKKKRIYEVNEKELERINGQEKLRKDMLI